MPSKPIVEIVTDNVFETLQGITREAGYSETLEVYKESRLGNIPTPTNMNNCVAVLVSGPDAPREDSPINKDDTIQTYYIDCIAIDSDADGELADPDATPDRRQHRIASDVRKALMIDHKRGGNPTNLDNGNAVTTYVRNASPLDLQQSSFRGVGLIVDVWYRTAQGDPYSL